MQLRDPNAVGIITGDPGTGKSSLVVGALKAGFRVIYPDFDNNIQPIQALASPEDLTRFHWLPFEDATITKGSKDFAAKNAPAPAADATPAKKGPVLVVPAPAMLKSSLKDTSMVELDGDPHAWADYLRFLDTGIFVNPDTGEVENFGPPSTWGPDTILFTDGLSGMVVAAVNSYYKAAGQSPMNKRRKDWGNEQSEIEAGLIKMTSRALSCHVFLASHLKLQGAEKLEDPDKNREEEIAYNNRRKMEEASLIEDKLLPRVPGRGLAPNVASHFPIHVMTKIVIPLTSSSGEGVPMVVYTPTKEITLKLPVRPGVKLAKQLPISTALVDIIEAVTGKRTP